MIDKIREDFEAVILKNKAAFQIRRVATGEYQNMLTQELWGAWQAATLAERERCALVCENERVEDTGYESDCGYNMAIGHCATAIRQGGAA